MPVPHGGSTGAYGLPSRPATSLSASTPSPATLKVPGTRCFTACSSACTTSSSWTNW